MEPIGRSLTASEKGKNRNLTPPVSPTPFMATFAVANPPPTSITAYSSKSLMKERWRTIINASRQVAVPTSQKYRGIRRWLLLAALPTALILLVATATTISWSNSVSRRRVVMPDIGFARRDVDEADIFERDSTVNQADEPVLSVGGITSDSTTTSPTPTTSLSFISSGSHSSSTPTTTLTVAPSVPSNPVLPTPFVQPFDDTLPSDFMTASCQVFFTNLTQTLTFRQCRPFSLLLPTSQGFLSSQTNLTLLNSIIYGTCNTTPSSDDCVSIMDGYQNQIQSQCSAELSAGNALAWDALNGFKNYAMYRQAACLENTRTNSYCFVDAVVAPASASDIYFYQLPLGTALPGTTSSSSAQSASATSSASGISLSVTCSPCTQSVMGVYATYATNSSLLISKTYSAAQRLVDSSCGSGYASAINAGTHSMLVGWTLGLLTPLLVLLVVMA